MANKKPTLENAPIKVGVDLNEKLVVIGMNGKNTNVCLLWRGDASAVDAIISDLILCKAELSKRKKEAPE